MDAANIAPGEQHENLPHGEVLENAGITHVTPPLPRRRRCHGYRKEPAGWVEYSLVLKPTGEIQEASRLRGFVDMLPANAVKVGR